MKQTRQGKDRISRREVIRRITLALGGVALTGSERLLAVLAEPDTTKPAGAFTQRQILLLDEMAETILPETQTPGAREAGVGPFIALMVTETYTEAEQHIFMQGLASLDDERAESGNQFIEANADRRLELLEQLDRQQHAYMKSKAAEAPAHWFRMMKELTLLGYFTSEIGCTQAQRYLETPGRFDPCVPYTPGERTWARHA